MILQITFTWSDVDIYVICVRAIKTMSSANSYSSTSTQHMCDMDRYVLRTSLFLHNFGRRFYRCQHWSLICIKTICSCPCSLYVNFFIYLISPSTIWYEFCHRTPIRLVSSLGDWTRTHDLKDVQQPYMWGKGGRDWQPRQKPPKMRGTMHNEWKQKH